jgi:hypothetical protein
MTRSWPFECDNCGHRPTPQEVVDLRASCKKCDDIIRAYTIDTAEVILDLLPKEKAKNIVKVTVHHYQASLVYKISAECFYNNVAVITFYRSTKKIKYGWDNDFGKMGDFPEEFYLDVHFAILAKAKEIMTHHQNGSGGIFPGVTYIVTGEQPQKMGVIIKKG